MLKAETASIPGFNCKSNCRAAAKKFPEAKWKSIAYITALTPLQFPLKRLLALTM
jgi:hypothetical protein